MTWLGRLLRSIGRKLICTCPDPERCPMFGERRRPIRLPANLDTTISPRAKAYIDALPSATLTVRLKCAPGEHRLIEFTRFGDRHWHYMCAYCSAKTACLHDSMAAHSLDNALDCQQCITEAEETAP